MSYVKCFCGVPFLHDTYKTFTHTNTQPNEKNLAYTMCSYMSAVIYLNRVPFRELLADSYSIQHNKRNKNIIVIVMDTVLYFVINFFRML